MLLQEWCELRSALLVHASAQNLTAADCCALQRSRTFKSDASRSGAESVDADPINAAFNAVVTAAGPESGAAPLLDLSSETPKADASPLVDVGDAEATAAAAGLRPRGSPTASMVLPSSCLLHGNAKLACQGMHNTDARVNTSKA